MLDLRKLHDEFQIPQCLRRNWELRVQVDPMSAASKEEYSFERFGARIISLLAMGIIFAALMMTTEHTLKSFDGVVVFLAAIVGLMSMIISEGATREEKESAKGFAKALEMFSKHSSTELHRMSSSSYKDLISDAERILFQFARTIMEYQEKGEITQAESFKHGTFAPVHEALNQLGLVENAWDRFFQKQPSPEIDDSMGPCD